MAAFTHFKKGVAEFDRVQGKIIGIIKCREQTLHEESLKRKEGRKIH